MPLTVHRRGFWWLAAVLMVIAVATGQVELGLGAVIAATLAVELLTWIGALGSSGGQPDRSSAP